MNNQQEYYDYEDIFLIPRYSDVLTRQEVDTGVELCGLKLNVPIISSNMDSITESDMCRAVRSAGGLGALHRFLTIDENVNEYKKFPDCLVSIGVNRDWKERAKALYDAGARHFVIDVAHGHSLMMKNTIAWLRKEFPSELHLIAGNVTTAEAVHDLEEWSADAIKVAIGSGCFAAGTRILMSNGTYKNIEEIKPGEFIINKNGKPVKVLNQFSTGVRKVIKLKTNHFYKPTYVTPDHQYWSGDLSSTSKTTTTSHGYAKSLSKKSKTIPKTSKFKWINIGSDINFVSLLPKNICFDLPKTFSIELKKRVGGNWRSGYKYKLHNILTPSYDLGYIFGTYLGDGHARTPKGKSGESNTVNWYFGLNELKLAERLSLAIKNIFNKTPNIIIRKNILQVSFGDKPFADFLSSFGKSIDKFLPDNLLVDNKEYLTGIYNGLIDSDGNVCDKRVSFINTSHKLIELFNVICYILNGSFPLNSPLKPTVGTLKNINLENCSQPLMARELINPKARFTNEYQIVKILQKEEQIIEVPVYDIEVDCETHSFVANNSIVHNSVCITKDVTGVTMPVFSAVLECSKAAQVPIIADGGAKKYGDVAKAIVAGATAVFSGKFFSGCDEIPERAKTKDGHASYRGMASTEAMMRIRTDSLPTAEGKSITVDRNGSAVKVVQEIAGGLRSAYSYMGARTTSEFRAKATYGIKRR